ncbi:hypothetical protein CN09_21810 [Rhizobium rhizogenes]|nr:hypothetical protein CN09_21810 [Rhizobium rhizogenes]OCJ09727.1 hypothetical protein A6U88_21480 [Agrobacterium sp. B131/95]OCJ23131.1 hypothetical protein A6U89_11045 [Agrobacterium sp. B133/95]
MTGVLPTGGAGFSNSLSPVAGGFSTPPHSESFEFSLLGFGVAWPSIVWPLVSGAWQRSLLGVCCAEIPAGIAAISEADTRKTTP